MQTSKRRLHLSVIALLGVAACSSPDGQQTSSAKCAPDSAVAAAIDAQWKAHVAGHLAKDPVRAAAIYDEDVWWRWEGGFDSRGRAKSEDFYRDSVYPQVDIVEMTYTSDEVLVCADAAHEVGRFTKVTDAAGKRATTTDHYMILWRKQADGTWRVVRGAGSALPPPPASSVPAH